MLNFKDFPSGGGRRGLWLIKAPPAPGSLSIILVLTQYLSQGKPVNLALHTSWDEKSLYGIFNKDYLRTGILASIKHQWSLIL